MYKHNPFIRQWVGKYKLAKEIQDDQIQISQVDFLPGWVGPINK
jgi:hypothetical protein